MKSVVFALILSLVSNSVLAVPRSAGIDREAAYIASATLENQYPISYSTAKRLLFHNNRRIHALLNSAYNICDLYERENVSIRETVQYYYQQGRLEEGDRLLKIYTYLCPQLP